MQRFQFITFILPWLFVLSASAEIRVTAAFNPPRIAMGDRAQYVVEITEISDRQNVEPERVTSLPIPRSGGLALDYDQTEFISASIDGVSGVTQKISIGAKPPRVGSFTIPTYTFQYKGQTYRMPAATLQVDERSADAEPTTDELIFLKTDTPTELYLGQTTPIQLKLYISETVRLNKLNEFDRSADGFTISELPESRDNMELYNGRRYRVLTWPLTITPIQTGEQDLNFQFTITAQVPNSDNRRDPFGGSVFGGSFRIEIFSQSERFNVYTEPTQVTVLPLPAADQPPSFTGAIGDFALKVYTDRESTKAGEPIMLSVEISGKGNFDRINAPIIPESNDWRNYEPESNFQPRSEGNVLRGTKRFDYVMIPNKSGTLEIPGIEFAYFEPEAKHYTLLNAPPIQIKVSPSDRPVSAPTTTNQAPTAPTTDAVPQQQELSMEEALLTLDYRPQSSQRSTKNPLQNIRFWIVNAASALVLIGLGFALRRKHRLRTDTAYAEQIQAKRERSAAAKAAHQAKDADTFYAHSQNAVRLALTVRAQQNLRTANIHELADAMQREGLDDNTIDATKQLFAQADALRFAGTKPNADLPAAKPALERILKAI